MIVTPIETGSIGRIQLPELAVGETTQTGPAFMQMLGSAVGELNGSVVDADASIRALAAGENVSVQDVMIAMEHAHLELQFAVEVRNRVVDAYQNLTNMQL
ncbi:MAG: flagellar hook-basal body complex protein FliE [Pseudomonadota bacterium]|nr:flagellar hook-basal body complex protein FliE [Pseudomonadota bacterium]